MRGILPKMSLLIWVLLSALLVSVFSLVGGVVLIYDREFCHQVRPGLVSFTAGVLLAVAFTNLLPESIRLSREVNVGLRNLLSVSLGGIIFFFFTEKLLGWLRAYPYSKEKGDEGGSWRVALGGRLHNFTDGVALAASFLVGIPLGVMVSLAVALHEVHRGMSNFTVMMQGKTGRDVILRLNLSAAFTAITGAALGYYLLSWFSALIPYVSAFVAGGFIYLASVNLLFETYHPKTKTNPEIGNNRAHSQSFFLLLGVVLTLVLNFLWSLNP